MEFVELPHNHGHNIEKIDFASKEKECQNMADIFKLLSDNTRIRIFWILCHYEECVINLAALLKMTSPAISHHLKQLKICGLITNRREGKEVYYKAADTKEAKLIHQMIENFLEITCPEK